MARRELRSCRRPAQPASSSRWCRLAAADRRPACPLPACPTPACRLPGLVRCHHLRPPVLLRAHRAALPGGQWRGERGRLPPPSPLLTGSTQPSAQLAAYCGAKGKHLRLACKHKHTVVWPASTPWRAPAPTTFLPAPAGNGHGLQQPVRVLRVRLPSLQRAPWPGRPQADGCGEGASRVGWVPRCRCLAWATAAWLAPACPPACLLTAALGARRRQQRCTARDPIRHSICRLGWPSCRCRQLRPVR